MAQTRMPHAPRESSDSVTALARSRRPPLGGPGHLLPKCCEEDWTQWQAGRISDQTGGAGTFNSLVAEAGVGSVRQRPVSEEEALHRFRLSQARASRRASADR